ncbi:MAG: hypothetical protein ABIX01_04070 [Chitinophagaceae bacterium]
MKRLFLAGSVAFLSLGFVHAQDLDAIKTQVLLRQYKAAKGPLDKAITVEKLTKKPEIWALRATVYSVLAEDSATAKDQQDILRKEAITSFNKYKELDPKYALMADNSYTNGPINLYTAAFKKGVAGFNTKSWSEAFTNFEAAVDYADFLAVTKIISNKMDTTSVLYAGASAQNLKDDDNAMKYFTRLTDANVAGKEYEFMYQFLANYYMNKKDNANFAKYIKLGRSLYPDSKYFPAVEEDYANSKDEYYLNMKEGEDLFAKLYPRDDKDIPQGDMAVEMENKMVAAFNKVAIVKPEKAGLAFTNLGNHYINKSVAINKKINELNDEIKAANKNAKPDKTGKLPPISKEFIATRGGLNTEYHAYTDKAIASYEKAADAFGKKASLENIEKQSFKNSVSFLIDLNAEKKSYTAKSNPAESAKFAAAEKKWSDMYSKIK